MKKISLSLIILLAVSQVSFANAVATTADPTEVGFKDLEESHPYYDAIIKLTDKKIVKGYVDGTYKASQSVTRSEMMKIIAEAAALNGDAKSSDFESKKSEANCFNDVSAGEWYTGYLCYGKQNNWIKGYSDGSFRPTQDVSYVEALKITYKGFGIEYTENSEPWYNDAVTKAKSMNWIPSSVGTDYTKVLNRGEMAELVSRVIEDPGQGSLPDQGGEDDGSCPEGTVVHEDLVYGYKFCYNEDAVLNLDIDPSENYSPYITINLRIQPPNKNGDYGDLSRINTQGKTIDQYIASLSNNGVVSNDLEFANTQDTEGHEYDFGSGGGSGHVLLFDDLANPRLIEIIINFAGEDEIEFMQMIKNTFEFLDIEIPAMANCLDINDFYENAEDGYSFCYDQAGTVAASAEDGIILTAPGVEEAFGYIEIIPVNNLGFDEYIESLASNGAATNVYPSINFNDLEYREYDFGSGGWSGHSILFLNEETDTFIQVTFAFASDNEVTFMEDIKETFRFI